MLEESKTKVMKPDDGRLIFHAENLAWNDIIKALNKRKRLLKNSGEGFMNFEEITTHFYVELPKPFLTQEEYNAQNELIDNRNRNE